MYVACHANGARILDISDPRSPRTLASFASGGEAWGVAGDGMYLWIADLLEGVQLYDVRDPSNPLLVAQAQNYAPHDIVLDGGYAYLADQDKGFGDSGVHRGRAGLIPTLPAWRTGKGAR